MVSNEFTVRLCTHIVLSMNNELNIVRKYSLGTAVRIIQQGERRMQIQKLSTKNHRHCCTLMSEHVRNDRQDDTCMLIRSEREEHCIVFRRFRPPPSMASNLTKQSGSSAPRRFNPRARTSNATPYRKSDRQESI
jgi:hypothetical protein